jgi:mRNA interferase YafQ
MYKIRWSSRFKRDVKLCLKQGKNMELFKSIEQCLSQGLELPARNKDHALVGNWQGCRECHITPDWLLIYALDEDKQEIEYIRMGSHSSLFKK